MLLGIGIFVFVIVFIIYCCLIMSSNCQDEEDKYE
jgi:hypothetical protein